MPMWWIRAFRHLTGRASAEVNLLAAAEEFLRRPRNKYDLPDETAIFKARVLLERALTPEQLRDLLARGYFYVKGKRFTYRIREGHSANVDALDSSGCVMIRFCAHPLGHVPVYDGMLAQKLWIETDESMFLKKAAPCPPH